MNTLCRRSQLDCSLSGGTFDQGWRLYIYSATSGPTAFASCDLTAAVGAKNRKLTRTVRRHSGRCGAQRNSACQFVVVLIVTLLSATTALAQSTINLPAPAFTLPFLPTPSGLWAVSIGAGGEFKPNFESADRYMLSPIPIFAIHRAGSADNFRSPRDGASIGLVDLNGFSFGPVAKFVPERKASRYTELSGFGDVKFAIELGGFAEYFPTDWFRTRIEVREGIYGHEGVVADLSADLIVPLLERFTVSGGPRFTLEDSRATAPYFGINAAQAMASGLPEYNAAGGAHSVGAGTQLRYQINPQWEAHSYVEYERLLGHAAASPLVTQRGSPNQTNVGVGVSYSFDLHIP